MIVRTGRPVEVMDNKILDVRVIDDPDHVGRQSLGGWIAMPREHWEALMRALETHTPLP